MSSNEKDYLKTIIQKSGFPLEISTGLLMEDRGWDVDYNPWFIDEDEKKGREIDLVGRKRFGLGDKKISNKLWLEVALIVECKKCEKRSVIVFTVSRREGDHQEYRLHLGSSFDPLKMTGDIGCFMEIHHCYASDREGRTFMQVAKKKKSEDPSIYKGVVTLAKATSHEVEEAVETVRRLRGIAICHLVYPILVLDGGLWEARVDGKDVELFPTEWVQLVSTYESLYYDDAPYFIDVVTSQYFPTLLEKIEKEHSWMVTKLSHNYDRIAEIISKKEQK